MSELEERRYRTRSKGNEGASAAAHVLLAHGGARLDEARTERLSDWSACPQKSIEFRVKGPGSKHRRLSAAVPIEHGEVVLRRQRARPHAEDDDLIFLKRH